MLDAGGRVERGHIVGAMSIRDGVVVNGVTAGPAATITPSMRGSPLTQSASSIADFAWVRLYPRSAPSGCRAPCRRACP